MPNIDNIVKVTLTRQTSAIPQTGFGTVLILSFDAPPSEFSEPFRSYSQGEYSSDFSSGPVKQKLDALFSQRNVPEKVLVGFVLSSDATTAAALTRIMEANNDFYCVIPAGASSVLTDAKQLEVAAWVEANKRIAFLDANDSGLYDATDATDLASKAGEASYSRTAVFFNKEADESLAAAIAGQVLPTIPGQEIFTYQKLSSVSSAGLTTTQAGVLNSKKANYFDTLASQNISFNGWMTDGGYIDIIRDTDWIVARLQENVVFQFVNKTKIPYSNAGVAMIIQSAAAVLQRAVSNGILAGNYDISRPNIDRIPVNDRANRKFPNINITGRILGAIQTVDFNVVISV